MLKKIAIIFVLILVIGFVAIQFFRPNFTNPPVNAAETLQASTQVPDNVQAILNRSCSDCHTNETKYPWYSKIQPSATLLANHITEGRQHLNLSVFNTYDTARKRRKFDQICEQVESGEMPMWSYTLIHRDGILSDEDKKTLCDWTNAESERLGAAK